MKWLAIYSKVNILWNTFLPYCTSCRSLLLHCSHGSFCKQAVVFLLFWTMLCLVLNILNSISLCFFSVCLCCRLSFLFNDVARLHSINHLISLHFTFVCTVSCLVLVLILSVVKSVLLTWKAVEFIFWSLVNIKFSWGLIHLIHHQPA